MKIKTKSTPYSVPEFIVHNGKPTQIILNIDDYQQILERLEDMEDLKILKKMREKPLHFRKLDDFLKEHHSHV